MSFEPDELYDGIGRITIEATGVERQLEMLVSALCGGLGMWLARGQSFGVLEQQVRSLLEPRAPDLPGELVQQIKTALSNTKELQEKRDAVVLGDWVIGEDGRRVAHKPKKYSFRSTPHFFAAGDLRELAHEFVVMGIRWFSLIWNVNVALGSGMQPRDLGDLSDLRDRVVSEHRKPPVAETEETSEQD
jgi:hypothetical protein